MSIVATVAHLSFCLAQLEIFDGKRIFHSSNSTSGLTDVSILDFHQKQ